MRVSVLWPVRERAQRLLRAWQSALVRACRHPVVYFADGTNATWQNVPTQPESPCTTDCHGFRTFLGSEAAAQRRAVRISFQHYGELQEYYDDPCVPLSTSWVERF